MSDDTKKAMQQIDEWVEEHRNSDAKGCMAGVVVARNGQFSKSFRFEFDQNISLEAFENAIKDLAIQLKVSLRMFDGQSR